MSEYLYGQFSGEHLKKMTKGIELYNTGFFWECHEELEHWWLEDTGDNARLVYWAVIQAAAAMYHYHNKNIIGARGLIKKAQNKLDRMEEKNVETKILYDCLSWKQFKSIIRTLSGEFEFEDMADLKEFKFISPEKWSLNE